MSGRANFGEPKNIMFFFHVGFHAALFFSSRGMLIEQPHQVEHT